MHRSVADLRLLWLRATGASWLPLALVAIVLVLDRALAVTPFHVLWTGLLDEPAHLATTAAVLLAVAPAWARRSPGLFLTALGASTLIDLDHVPLFLGVEWVAADPQGRPFTHSMTTLVVLVALAVALRRARPVLLAVLTGISLHFLRDLFTGPGLPILWPLSDADVLLPYPVYAILLVALGVLRLVVGRREVRRIDTGRGSTSVR